MEDILIPMEVLHHIESIEFSGVKEYKVGDTYYYNPDRYIDIELNDSGFFKEIDNSKCDFLCNITRLDFHGKDYSFNDKIDISNVLDDAISNLCLVGYIKKVLKEDKPAKIIKKSKAKKKSYKNSDIAKELNITFKELKQKAVSANIEIGKASDKIKKADMKKIIEVLK